MYRQPFKGEYRITQKYREYIPGVTVGSSHTGIDYGTPSGTQILASGAGTVMFSGWDTTGYGICIIIRHTSDRSTLYAHLSKAYLIKGDRVEMGQLIGLSGDSGNATGPHLHFEARTTWNDYKSHFDPMALPLTSVDDSIGQIVAEDPAGSDLKGAEDFKAGDLLEITAPLGAKAFYDAGFAQDRMTPYNRGSRFYYTGQSMVRRDNGITYMLVTPIERSLWIAVNDGETQILDGTS